MPCIMGEPVAEFETKMFGNLTSTYILLFGNKFDESNLKSKKL